MHLVAWPQARYLNSQGLFPEGQRFPLHKAIKWAIIVCKVLSTMPGPFKSQSTRAVIKDRVLSTCYIVKRENFSKSNPTGLFWGEWGWEEQTHKCFFTKKILKWKVWFFPSKKSISNQDSTCVKTKSSRKKNNHRIHFKLFYIIFIFPRVTDIEESSWY